MSKVYDVFADKYIDRKDIDPIAPPERYKEITQDLLCKNAASWNDKKDLIPYERYRLVLRHEIIDDEGKTHDLDKPIVVNHILTPITSHSIIMSKAVLINEMMDMLKDFLLRQIIQKDGEE